MDSAKQNKNLKGDQEQFSETDHSLNRWKDFFFLSEIFFNKFGPAERFPIVKSEKNTSRPGLPDFSWYKIPKREKYAKLPRTIPNVHNFYVTKDRKMDQSSVHKIYIPTSSLARPSQIYPNLDFFGLKTNHLATLIAAWRLEIVEV
jgi:hypothetical protein